MIKIDFNTEWLFRDCQTGEQKILNLPHDATIGTDRDPNIRIGYLSAFFHGGKYEYTKKFFLKEEQKNQAVYLELEGIYRNSTVFINGTQVSALVNGYIGICERIDSYLYYEKENEIKVCIDTPYNDHTRWYAGSGIYRDVFLHIGKARHIKPHGVRIQTSGTKAIVEVQAVGDYDELEITIYDGDTPVAKYSGESEKAELEISKAKLWSDETPYLYTAEVKLVKDGANVDCARERFGVRTLSWNAQEGFLVNGKRTLLRGGCIHCDNGILGMITTRETELRRVKKIKAAGFNAIRSAHHPASPALLEACDEIGLYVMEEAFDAWYRMKTINDFSSAFYKEYPKVLNAMVEKSFNHPSVIMYSIGNEIPEIGSIKGIRFGKDMIRLIKEKDTTRPVLLCPSMRLAKDFLYGMPYDKVDEDEWLKDPDHAKEDFAHYVKVWTRGLANVLSVFEYTDERKEQDERATKELYDALDIAGYNYYGEYYEDLHKIHPERVILGTETEGNKLSYHFEKMKKTPYVIGDFVWTLQDHLGECNCAEYRYGEDQADKSYPWITNWCGKLDLIGNENITAHRYRMVWGLEKGIVLAAQLPVHNGVEAKFGGDRETDAVMSWSFEGCEGNKTYLDIVTDAPYAEVFINGESLGKKKTEDFSARFFCEYHAGEAVAVGYDENGKELYRNGIKTAEKETLISVSPERTTLRANGQDLCFIPLKITDKNGIAKVYPERKIKIDVTGAGSLAGFGSAAYRTEESYTDNTHTTFEGKCLAVVRAGTEAGKITVAVTSEGLASQIFEIEVIA